MATTLPTTNMQKTSLALRKFGRSSLGGGRMRSRGAPRLLPEGKGPVTEVSRPRRAIARRSL